MQLPGWVIAGSDAIYHTAQWLDPTHRLARLLKRGSKRFCRSIEQIQRRATAAAAGLGFDGVITGHSHVARHTTGDGIHYLNCGCWTEIPSAFVGIRQGRARRYYWESVSRQQHGRRRVRASVGLAARPVLGSLGFDPAAAAGEAVAS